MGAACKLSSRSWYYIIISKNNACRLVIRFASGKTHAYILAVTIHYLFSRNKLPTIISTSTIALQKALTEEYIPQISDIFMEHRIIDSLCHLWSVKENPIMPVTSRVKGYRSSIVHNNRWRTKKCFPC